MIKVRKRTAVFGAGSLAVVGMVTSGVLLGGLSGGSAFAGLSPEKEKQIIEDCDSPDRIQDPDGVSQGVPGTFPGTVDNPGCDIEPVEDLGQVWGPADKAWADGKDKPVPACETTTTANKSEGHTTGTNFNVGFSVGVDKELPGKVKPKLDARFGWTFVDTTTTTYGESFEVKPYHMGWWEVRSALRKVKVDIDAKYQSGDKNEYKLEDIEMTVPDPDTQDAWVGRSRKMTDKDLKDFCGKDAPSDDPTGEPSPTASPVKKNAPHGRTIATETRSIVNVLSNRAADVDENRGEVHAMPASGGTGQQWNLKKQDDGSVVIEPAVKPGWALGYNTDPAQLDQGVQPYAFVSEDGKGAIQHWRINGAGGDAYTIENDRHNCLTDPGNDGGTIGVSGCVGGDQQRWRLTGS